MASRRADRIARSFFSKVKRLDNTRRRIEAAFRNEAIRLSDVESTYTGLYLQAVLAYEAAIEALVLGLLVRPGGIRSMDPHVRARVTVRSYAHALELASGPGREFADWMSKHALLARATMLLHDGAPFTRLGEHDWAYVHRAKYIRNAIAHPSRHALAMFTRKVIGATPLPAKERTVAGYLRGSAGTAQTRWELNVAGLSVFVGQVAV